MAVLEPEDAHKMGHGSGIQTRTKQLPFDKEALLRWLDHSLREFNVDGQKRVELRLPASWSEFAKELPVPTKYNTHNTMELTTYFDAQNSHTYIMEAFKT